MINLLPPSRKRQIRYAKLNIKLLRYIFVSLVIALLLTALIGISFRQASSQAQKLQQNLSDRQAQRGQYQDTEAKVKTLQANLATIEKLFNNKTEFSSLLQDLAAVLPADAYINKITLTGDDKKPVQLLITVNSLDTAGILRNALLKSQRIASVDIQSVNLNPDPNNPNYSVDTVIAFKPGGAR